MGWVSGQTRVFGLCYAMMAALLCLVSACTGESPANRVWLVSAANTSGLENGVTWGSAFTDVQSAVNTASPGDEVWISAGIYRPTAANQPILHMKDGVSVIGGFAGSERSVAARPKPRLLTELSGDFEQNDEPGNDLTLGDNSCHVVVGASDALLAGITLSAGNANCDDPDGYTGGGMYNPFATNLILHEMTFRGNTARSGGGIYNSFSSPTITDSAFIENTARFGGALFNSASSPALSHVVFSNNSALTDGGGIMNFSSSAPTLSDTTFHANSARFGGGIHNDGASPVIANAAFSLNASERGGAIYNVETGTAPSVTRSSFSANHASIDGGGISNHLWTTLSVSDSTFSENSADADGGAVWSIATSMTITNSAFSQNSASNGGAILYEAGSAIVTNSTFSDNAAFGKGAIHANAAHATTDFTLSNSVLWGNAGSDAGVYIDGSIFSPLILNTCSEEILDGNDNAAVEQSPFDMPYASPLIFLDPSPGLACIDLGSDDAASSAGIEWSAQSTQVGGALDMDSGDGLQTGSDVDAGRHYYPGTVRIETLSAGATDLAWTTSFAEYCQIFNDSDATWTEVSGTILAAGNLPHGKTSGVRMTLVCFGQVGEPAIAHAIVPDS